jgi:Spy/CpxP family protein refolding chaperone
MRRRVWGMGIVAAGWLFGASAAAHDLGGGHRDLDRGRHGVRHRLGMLACFDQRHLGQLNLSNDQQQSIQKAREEHRNKLTELRKELRGKKEELKRLLASPDASSDDIRDRYNDIAATKKKMADAHMEYVLRVRDTLRPEQRARLRAVCPYGREAEQPGGGGQPEREGETHRDMD